MARHKQPEALAKLKGAPKKNPQRYKTKQPVNKNLIGAPPAAMDADAKKIWAELLKYSLPGVITASERFIFEIASNLMAEYRKSAREFPATKYGHLIGCLARLGLSPTDRQKLGVNDDDGNGNEFDGFK